MFSYNIKIQFNLVTLFQSGFRLNFLQARIIGLMLFFYFIFFLTHLVILLKNLFQTNSLQTLVTPRA